MAAVNILRNKLALFTVMLMLHCLYTTAQTDTIPTRDNNLAMGNPSNATSLANDSNNYLLVRSQYALSYNNRLGIPNWVSWHLSRAWKGSATRCNCFTQDAGLPAGYFRATTGNYTGSGYDRGHLCPSDDRDGSDTDNAATFHMSNIAPQAPYMNEQTWAYLEDYCRGLAGQGNEMYVMAGGYGSKGTIASGSITVPQWFWKVVLVLPTDTGDVARVATSNRVIAILIPNDDTVNRHAWDYYRVSVDTIEALTGYDLLSNVDTAVQRVIEARTDMGATPLVAWDFTGANNAATWLATGIAADLDTAGSRALVTRGSTAPASTGNNSFRTTGFKNEGIATTNTDYYQVSLKAASGHMLSLTTIDATFAGTGSFCVSPGVLQQFAYSLDGSTFTLIGSPFTTIGSPGTMPTIDISGISALQHVPAGTTVYLRYYASGATTTGGWGFYSADTGTNGLWIGGTVEAVGFIEGAASLCAGGSTTLSHSTAGGAWSSSNTAAATIDAASGMVTAVAGGTSVISYTVYGSIATHTLTVLPQPGAISGTTMVQAGAATILSNAVAGGAWSAQTTTVATVGSNTGIVTGIAPGTTLVTYAISTCTATTTVTVTSPAEPALLCQGASITLADTVSGGTWVSSNQSIARVAATTGIVTGVNAARCIIWHIRAGGAARSYTVTVNPLAPINTTGPSTLCQGLTRTYTNTTPGGGIWSVNDEAIATVTTSGIVTGVDGGMAVLSYTTSAGCQATKDINITDTAPITGSMSVCVGQTTTVSTATGGGRWVSSSGALATVSAAGIVGGVHAGNPRIYYIWPTGCQSVVTLTVNPLVYTSGGTPGMCQSSSMTLVNTTPGGGVWSSSNTAIATVSGGVVRGAGAGSAIISFTTAAGCTYARPVAVNGCREADTTTTTEVVRTNAAVTDLVLSPNPGTGTFILDGTIANILAEQITVEVANMQGQLVLHTTIKAVQGVVHEQVMLPVSVPAGMYMLRLGWDGGAKVFHLVMSGR